MKEEKKKPPWERSDEPLRGQKKTANHIKKRETELLAERRIRVLPIKVLIRAAESTERGSVEGRMRALLTTKAVVVPQKNARILE